MKRRLYYLKDAGSLLILLGVCLWLLWPLVSQPTTRTTNDYDGLLYPWIETQLIDHFTTFDLAHFWDGGIFYPEKRTLAYSDPFIPLALASIPVWLLTHEPIAVLTYSTLLGYVMTLMMIYFLLHELTSDRITALGLSLIFGFCPIYFQYLGHLHTIALWGLPLSWLALVRILQTKQKGWACVWWLAFISQTYSSFLAGMFIGLTTGLIVWHDHRLRDLLWQWRRFVLCLLGLSVLVLLPLVWPFIQVSQTFHYTRSIRDAAHFSLSVNDWWTINLSVGLWLLLLISGIISLIKKKTPAWLPAGWLMVTGLILSLGPVLKWSGHTVKMPWPIPLPYALLFYLVPGFNGFRTPSRWLVVFALAGVVWSAQQFVKLKATSRRLIVGGLLIGQCFFLPHVVTVPVPSVAEYLAVYQWLKQQPGKVVIELPIFPWGSTDFSKNEVWRMLYSTYTKKALVNGYSGYSSLQWEEDVRLWQSDFPSTEALNRIKLRGVDYLVVHPQEYDAWQGQGAGKRIVEALQGMGYSPIYFDGQTSVYQLSPD